jgi:peptidoglycan/LPS O-acetylase OafA/YrhL
VATLQYRADVDGLRAVAVLPVLFFHVGLPGTSGGYVGVDVFFVISGFLITSILHQEMLGRRFSIVRFYERRVRRLWPALVVVIAASILLSYFLLLPSLLKDFGQSLVAVTVFASNVLFFGEAGYFDGPAELKPLLHTWSLAVEEQFYVFFPPFLWLLHRFAKRAIAGALVVVCVLSLVASVVVLERHQSAVFYLLPFRAWEMLFGSLLAIGIIPAFRDARIASVSGLAGLAMILVPVAVYDSSTPFPGLMAVVPCLGTAMIIHAGMTPGGWAAKVLSLSPMVFVGKISYSLYLWHWPLIVFGRYLAPSGEVDLPLAAGLVVASLAMGALSWRYVEAPFRDAKGGFSARTMFVGAAVVSAAWLGIGVALHVTNGLPNRLSPEARRLAAAVDDFQPEPDACRSWAGPNDVAEGLCVVGAPEATTPSYFLWGDSHAGILVHGFDVVAKEAGRSGLYSNLAGCPPLAGVAKDESVADAAVDARCAETNARVMRVIESVDAIDTVILVSRWAYYANGGGVGSDEHHTVDVWRTDEERGTRPNPAVVEDGILQTVARLRALGKRVVLLRQVPEIDDYQASSLAQALLVGSDGASERMERQSKVTRARVAERQASFERVAATLANREGVVILDPSDFFCDASECHAIREGRPLYFDNNHVTTSTSRDLAPFFAATFAD